MKTTWDTNIYVYNMIIVDGQPIRTRVKNGLFIKFD